MKRSKEFIALLGFGTVLILFTFANFQSNSGNNVSIKMMSVQQEAGNKGCPIQSETNLLDQDFMETRQDIYRERRDRVRQACARNRLTRGRPDELVINKTLIVSHEHRLVYCPNAKTGSSTWMHHFREMLHLPKVALEEFNAKFHKLIPMMSGLPSFLSVEHKIMLLKEKLGFTFVRHPFVRLVSAYLDKVVNNDYHRWRKKTIFYKRIKYHPDDIPRFDQFVDYILSGREDADNHIQPYWKHCDVCHINYNIIGKTETSSEDNKYIFMKAGLDGVLDPSTQDHRSHSGNTTAVAKQLFGSLTKTQAKGLYDKYQMDFELFGYDAMEYIELAQEDNAKRKKRVRVLKKDVPNDDDDTFVKKMQEPKI